MWKYACQRTVSGTPTVFINGVKLDTAPRFKVEWMNHLQQVYDSQYRAATFQPNLFMS